MHRRTALLAFVIRFGQRLHIPPVAGDKGTLPVTAGTGLLHPFINRLQIAVALGGLDTQQAQSVSRLWQQLVEQ